VRLGAVLDLVGAGRRLTQASGAHTALAVGRNTTRLPGRTRRAARSAAIDGAFGAVLHEVRARGGLARRRADEARAAGARRTPAARAARHAPAAAAIGSRLLAVLDRIGAGGRLADVARTVFAHAVGVADALLGVRTGRAAAAAIHVGFV